MVYNDSAETPLGGIFVSRQSHTCGQRARFYHLRGTPALCVSAATRVVEAGVLLYRPGGRDELHCQGLS